MIFIKSEELKPGMVLAKDINLFKDGNLKSVLLSKNEVLSNSYINKIIFYGIYGIYVKNDNFDDLKVVPLISEEIKVKTLTSIENIFTHASKGIGKLEDSEIKHISNIVEDLTNEVILKKDLSCNIVDFKNHDDYTYEHCLSVSVLSIITGMSLGLSENKLHDLAMAALLHDIGKSMVPVEIINKPGRLTTEEFDEMKKHPLNGVSQLRNLVSDEILDGIESHHENLDGSGYPMGKKEENISLYGKIISICDVYDALTSQRSYRNACIPGEAIEYLMGSVGSKFDYEVVLKFIKNITAYPVGSFVKLSNGKTCVVVKNYTENIMRPLVRVINPDNSTGEDIDLLNDFRSLNITIVENFRDKITS